jgi:hypothetical protein
MSDGELYREIKRRAEKYGFGYDLKKSPTSCFVCQNKYCSHFDGLYRLIVAAGGTAKVVSVLGESK